MIKDLIKKIKFNLRKSNDQLFDSKINSDPIISNIIYVNDYVNISNNTPYNSEFVSTIIYYIKFITKNRIDAFFEFINIINLNTDMRYVFKNDNNITYFLLSGNVIDYSSIFDLRQKITNPFIENMVDSIYSLPNIGFENNIQNQTLRDEFLPIKEINYYSKLYKSLESKNLGKIDLLNFDNPTFWFKIKKSKDILEEREFIFKLFTMEELLYLSNIIIYTEGIPDKFKQTISFCTELISNNNIKKYNIIKFPTLSFLYELKLYNSDLQENIDKCNIIGTVNTIMNKIPSYIVLPNGDMLNDDKYSRFDSENSNSKDPYENIDEIIE